MTPLPFISVFRREEVIWTPVGLLFTKFGNLSINFIRNMKAPNFYWVQYLKFFGTSQLKFAIDQLYYFKAIFA